MEKRLVLYKIASRIQSVPIAERLLLLYELDGSAGCSLAVCFAIAGRDDHTYFRNVCAMHLFEDDAENGFFNAVPVDQHLKGKRALITARRGDDRLLNSHFDARPAKFTGPPGSFPIL